MELKNLEFRKSSFLDLFHTFSTDRGIVTIPYLSFKYVDSPKVKSTLDDLNIQHVNEISVESKVHYMDIGNQYSILHATEEQIQDLSRMVGHDSAMTQLSNICSGIVEENLIKSIISNIQRLSKFIEAPMTRWQKLIATVSGAHNLPIYLNEKRVTAKLEKALISAKHELYRTNRTAFIPFIVVDTHTALKIADSPGFAYSEETTGLSINLIEEIGSYLGFRVFKSNLSNSEPMFIIGASNNGKEPVEGDLVVGLHSITCVDKTFTRDQPHISICARYGLSLLGQERTKYLKIRVQNEKSRLRTLLGL